MNILIVDDEINIRKTLAVCLETEGHNVIAVSNAGDAVSEVSRRSIDLVFLDLRLGTDDGLELIKDLLSVSPWLRIIVITAYASIDTAVEAIKRGATDYIPKPFTPEQIRLSVHKICEMRSLEQKIVSLQEDISRMKPEANFSSNNPAMQRIIELARQAASSEATILLTGESGTGKSALARAVHSWSSRAKKPFGAVSCPSFSLELLESELFGHVKGAFTNAIKDNIGRIAACEGGTLFLDEVGDLPSSIQPKLLRFIQEKEFERVGDHTTCKADVRIIAATNIDLEKAIKEGRFREDLFYRLNVIQLQIPPLRERPEDLLDLANRLLAFHTRNHHRRITDFTDEAIRKMEQYDWPGNIRELSNVIERAIILCQGESIDASSLPQISTPSNETICIGDSATIETVEEQHIRRILAISKSLKDAADTLGIDQATLWRRRKKYGI